MPTKSPVWVKRVGFAMSAICPVYPKHQTLPGPVGTSHLCQKQTCQPRVARDVSRHDCGKAALLGHSGSPAIRRPSR
jgi:hypothetical protein